MAHYPPRGNMVEKTRQGPALSPPRQQTTLPSAPKKTTAADPSLQASRKQFSSLLEKSGSKGEKAAGKLQQHVEKGLDSVRKRLDRELLAGQPRDASRRASDKQDKRLDSARRHPDRELPGGQPRDASRRASDKQDKRLDSARRHPDRELPGGQPRDASRRAGDEQGKRLDSARRHPDRELSGGQPHDASRRAGDEKKDAQRDTARDVTDLSPAGTHTAHTPVSTEATASPAVQETAPPVHDISRVAQQIADRILVSPPGSTTNPEVRIQLKSSFLDGSEVRVFREGGELKVVFIANTKDAENLVMQNKNQLEQVLGDRLKDERVQVSVELRDGRGTEGEHNEGRSRQQYVAPDDTAEDE